MVETKGYEVELKLVIDRRPLALSVTADPASYSALPLPQSVRVLLDSEPPQRFEAQHDTYFGHPQIDIAGADQVLRHRENTLFIKKQDRWELQSHRDILTWKGPAQRIGALKSREEIEVDGSVEILTIFRRLGFVPALEIRKHRWISYAEAITISLDAVGELGFFLELEVLTGEKEREAAAATIEKFRRERGLLGFPEEPRSYAKLLQSC